MLDDKKFCIKIFLIVIISYALIKLIDNYKFFFNSISLLLSLLTPFVIAFILAYMLNPFVTFFEEKLKLKRVSSLTLTYGLFIGLITAFIIFTVPSLVSSLADMANQIPSYSQKTQSFFVSQLDKLKDIDPQFLKESSEKVMSLMPQISTIIADSIGQFIDTTFSIGKFIFQFGLAVMICFYILKDKEHFISFGKKILYLTCGDKYSKFTLDVCKLLNKNIGKYFASKVIDSTIVGVLSGIGLYFIGSKYALLFGTLMIFMNLIPYFGPILGMAPVVIINLYYNPTIAAMSLIYLLIIQQLELIVIEPKIVGSQLDLSAFLTILAVTIGGGFFGIPGMILSVPIMGVIKIYFVEYLEYKHNKIISEQ